MFKVGGTASVLYVISFLVGLPWGIRGVALSYAICVGLLLLPSLYIPFRLIDLTLIDLGYALKGIVASTALMGVVVLASRRVVTGYVHMAPVVDLFLFTAVGAVVYAVTTLLQRVPVLLDLSQMVASIVAAPISTCRPDRVVSAMNTRLSTEVGSSSDMPHRFIRKLLNALIRLDHGEIRYSTPVGKDGIFLKPVSAMVTWINLHRRHSAQT